MLAGIPGTARRLLAERALEEPNDPSLPPVEFLFAEALSGEEREAWSQVDPWMMGGEYLPALEPGEVEIARVELESVTGDVIQVRARLAEYGIHYRVVDEYGSRLVPTIERSDQPLSFGELVNLIDGTSHKGESQIGLTDWYLDMNYDGGSTEAVDLISFVTVSSAHYPTLERYYGDRTLAWYERIEAEEAQIGRREPLPASGVWDRDASPAMRVPLAIAFGLGYLQGRIQRLLGRRT